MTLIELFDRWQMKPNQAGSDRARDAKIVALYEATPDVRGFFESVLGFSGLEGRWFKVSAKDQKRYFGKVIFGKRSVRVGADGKVSVFHIAAFGNDHDIYNYLFDHVRGIWCQAWGNDMEPATQPSHL